VIPAGSNVGHVLRAVVRAPTGAAALGAVTLLIVLAIAGPIMWGSQARTMDVARGGEGPSPEHLFGTDRLGRDILARTLTAARLSLGLALAATATAAVIGFPFGAVISVLGGRARAVASSLDLRGARVEEALAMLDQYLDDAAHADAGRVTVIHGHGSGAMRDAVRRTLGSHPLVREWRPGERGEGGDGATVVSL